MDEFEQAAREVEVNTTPATGFVSAHVVSANVTQQPKKNRALQRWLSIAAVGLVIVAVAVVALFSHHSTVAKTMTITSHGTVANGTSNQSAGSQAAPAAGTDNASLTSNLNDITSSANQETTDQSTADSALNDQSQQITVPTNN